MQHARQGGTLRGRGASAASTRQLALALPGPLVPTVPRHGRRAMLPCADSVPKQEHCQDSLVGQHAQRNGPGQQ